MSTRSLLLRGGDVLTPLGLRHRWDVRIDDGIITAVAPALPVDNAEIIDVERMIVAPGFIDMHVHGASGAMCEAGELDQLQTISATLARFGVTGFLPTIATLPRKPLRAAVSAVSVLRGREQGAQILGINLEGPYLSPERAGAQSVAAMRAPSIAEFDELQDLGGGLIRLITVAPEREGALGFIRAMGQRGVAVSAGHSNATEAQMLLAIEAGVAHVTHLFNAMRELHHREPGIAGVALTDDRVSTELICDGHHLSPRTVDLALRSKPPLKVVLISDAVGALGMPEGQYEIYGIRCAIEHGAVRMTPGGQLAGSCLALDQAVRNVRQWKPSIPLGNLLHAASWAPALAVGLEQQRGTVEKGKAADLVLLDGHLNVLRTWRAGIQIWPPS